MEFVQKLKKGIEPVDKWMKKFIYTDFYMLLILAIVFIAWVTRSATFGFVALILVSSFVLLFADDVLPLLVNIFASMLMIYKDKVSEYVYLWPTFIPLVIAIVVFIVRNVKVKMTTPGKKFVLGKMFFPQLAVSIALLLGGVGVIESEAYLATFPITFMLGIGTLAVYLIIRNFTKTDGDFDRTVYFAKMMAYIGMVVGIQLVILIAKSGLPSGEWNTGVNWNAGWGGRNTISTYLVITAPMCMYLFTKHRMGFFYFLMAAFQYVCLLFTFSRGGILFGFIAFVFGLILVVYKAKDRKRQLCYIALTAVILGIVFLALKDTVLGAIKSLIDRGTGLSGRDNLYDEAIVLFKANPFQGAGLGYIGYGPGGYNEMKTYWFHSTLFQVIACMGVLGLLAYAFSYTVKVIILCKNLRSTFNLFAVVTFMGFEGYAMMNTGTFVPFPFAMLIITFMCIIEMFTSNPDTAKYDKLSKTEIYVREEKKPVEKLEENPV